MLKYSRIVLPAFFLLLALSTFGQTAGSALSSWGIIGLIAIIVLLVLSMVIMVGDNLLVLEAKRQGLDTSSHDLSITPKAGAVLGGSVPAQTTGAPVIRLKKGYDILLEGAAEKKISEGGATTYAIRPTDFIGMTPIPKLMVEVGQSVNAGDPLFFDKPNPDVLYCAPVSGEVIAINRGEKRSIAEVVILADKTQSSRSYDLPGLNGNREALVQFLLSSGVWPMIRQRPYNTVANPADTPKSIFISTFDTAPLAPDLNLVVEGRGDDFQKGLDVLSHLTSGKVHLGLDGRSKYTPSPVFSQAKGVVKHSFNGKHPAGNVSVHIHHVDPVDAHHIVWTLGVQDVLTIGALFNRGQFDTSRVIALSGSELSAPQYVKTHQGAQIGELLKPVLPQEDGKRIIAGDVLSGQQTNTKQYLPYYADQITVIKEGDYVELFGWLLPSLSKPSVSRAFPNFLFPNHTFEANTNMHGEKRAFVVTGQYEDLLPMDIYPQHLMKAILVNDFERMEGLGIYELVEEDVALCEFACTSKQPLQQILRKGLNAMREQG